MDVLVYGAGPIGSLYATRFQQAGHRVSVLARGARLADLMQHGIVLRTISSDRQTAVRVHVVEELSPEDQYDLIVVTMRLNYIEAVLPRLAANKSTVLIMANNPLGFDEWRHAVGPERLLLGFPGAGGIIRDQVVEAEILKKHEQATTLAEPDGRVSKRLLELVRVFRAAGFPTVTSTNMDAWLKTHAAWIVPITGAVAMAREAGCQPAEMPEAIQLMLDAQAEGFRVMESLGVPLQPKKFKYWRWYPIPLLRFMYRSMFKNDAFKTMMIGHTLAAADEEKLLCRELMSLADRTQVRTIALRKLSTFITALPDPKPTVVLAGKEALCQ